MRKKLVKTAEFRAEMKELAEQRADLLEAMNKIVEDAKTEKRAFAEEEQKQFDECEKKIKNIDDTIEKEKRAIALSQTKKAESKKDAKNSTTNVKTDAEIRAQEIAEERAFAEFIRGNVAEIRADEIQLTQGNNGNIVPTSIANKIIEAVRDTVPYLTLADVINTNGKLSVPVYGEDSTNYINAGYVDENTALTDNVGKFTTVDLTGYVIGALSLVSNKLVTNTDIDVVNFIVKEVARAISEKLEKEFTQGTTGKISGIFGETAKVTTAAATAITYDEILELKHELKQQYRKNAVWIMNDSTYTALCKLKDDNGQPYFKDDDYMILNNKVIVSDSVDEIAAGKKVIAYADLSGYTIKGAKSIEVTVLREKYADKNMLGVIGYAEYDAKVTDGKKIAVLAMKAS